MLVPDLVPTGVVDAAVEALWQLVPRPEEFRDPDHPRRRAFLDLNRGSWAVQDLGPEEPAFREEQFVGHLSWPFHAGDALNRLVVEENVLAFAEAALGAPDIRLYQAGVWAKYAGAASYAQPFHLDRNHSWVPLRAERGWWFLEGFLYLSDVDDDSGAPRLVPRAHAPDSDPGRALTIEETAALDAHAVSVPGRRGSFLAYRGDVWHRATALEDPDASRFVLIVCFKLAHQEWIGFDAMHSIVDHWRFPDFVAGSTPRELEVVGFPRPGHAFWTEAGVDALALRYPGLDVEPWRRALVRR